MLMGYTIVIPIPDKKSETVCGAYRDSVYCIFGGSSRIPTDNTTEFKSQEMKGICETLNIKHVFSPAYTPQANGRLEGWHCFLKACISKHIRGTDLEWDKLVPLAVSAYNFFPCQSSRESPFVLMFGRDLITPIVKLLEPRPRYYGDKGGTLWMDTLRKLYLVTAENIRRVREKKPSKKTSSKLQIGDLVFVRDPDSGVFEPRYSPNYRVVAIHGANRIEVQDEKGHKSVRRAGHLKRIDPVDKICQQLPPEEVYKQFGRANKLLLHPKDVPDIKLLEGEETINREVKEKESTTLCEISEDMDVYKKSETAINTVFETNTVHMTGEKESTMEKNNEKLTGQLANKEPPSKNGEKLINHLGEDECEMSLPYGGEEKYMKINTDIHITESKKCENQVFTTTQK